MNRRDRYRKGRVTRRALQETAVIEWRPLADSDYDRTRSKGIGRKFDRELGEMRPRGTEVYVGKK